MGGSNPFITIGIDSLTVETEKMDNTMNSVGRIAMGSEIDSFGFIITKIKFFERKDVRYYRLRNIWNEYRRNQNVNKCRKIFLLMIK